MGNLSKNFSDHEFVPPEVYDSPYPNKWFIAPIQVNFSQFTKDFFVDKYVGKEFEGKVVKNVLIVINNWKTGGRFKYRGFRPPNEDTGAKLSQHRFCNAIDFEVILVFEDGTRKELSPDTVRKIILENEKVFMEAGLTTLETGRYAPGWIHADFRWTGKDNILMVGG